MFNGVEVQRFASAEPWPTDGPTVLFVGRHEPRKGLDVLLSALEELPAEVRIWVAGTGPDTDALQARFTDERIEQHASGGDVAGIHRRHRGAPCRPLSDAARQSSSSESPITSNDSLLTQ